MSDIPCPKCGADADDIGAKMVCSQCYWVFDKGSYSPPSSMNMAASTMFNPKSPPFQPSIPGGVPPQTSQAPSAQSSGARGSGMASSFADPSQPARLSAPAGVSHAAQNPQAPAPASNALTASGSTSTPSAPICPKCGGETVTIAGNFVCGSCYFVLDQPAASAATVASAAPEASKAPTDINRPQPVNQINNPGTTGSAPNIAPANTPNNPGPTTAPSNSNLMQNVPPPTPTEPRCPKCNAETVVIAGNYVCGSCYFVLDQPVVNKNNAAATPSSAVNTGTINSSSAAAAGYVPRPSAQVNQTAINGVGTASGNNITAGIGNSSIPQTAALPLCPKCNSQTVDVSGKYVCGSCYHVLDTPQTSIVSKAAPQVASAPAVPTSCPKCGAQLIDISGKNVCGSCYFVVEPLSTPNSLRPKVAERNSEEASPIAIFGILVILFLIIVTVFMLLKH